MTNQPLQYATSESELVEETTTGVNSEPAGLLAPARPTTSSDQAWKEWIEPVSDFFSDLPDYLGRFFSEYKQPLLTLLLITSGLITVKVILAVLDAVNDIPLLSPIFELVGMGYTGWFVYRYLLRASSRQELNSEFKSLKGQVIGSDVD